MNPCARLDGIGDSFQKVSRRNGGTISWPDNSGVEPACDHVVCVVHVFCVSTARNITLTLDEETLREARVLAAQRGLSVSAFLRLELAGLVERQRGFDRAKASAAKRLKRAQALGGGKLPIREELHDRAKLR